MAWSLPSNNTGFLVRPNGETTFIGSGFSSREFMIAEPVGNGTMEVSKFRNDGNGSYLITVRAQGSVLVRFHGDRVN